MACELKPSSVYIVQHPDGLCTLHSSPTEDEAWLERERDFEEQLRAEFVWVEKLGIILARADGSFAAEDCYKLVLRSPKRMVLVSDWDTLEYRPCDWGDLPLM